MCNKDKMWHEPLYERTNCEVLVEDSGMCQLYGVCCKNREGENLMVIADVSPDSHAVDRLVGLLNQYGVSSIHAKEVVEDFIALL